MRANQAAGLPVCSDDLIWGTSISKGGRMRLHDRCQWVLVVAAVSATAVVSAGPVALAAPVAPGQTVHQAMGDQPAFQFSESMLSGLVLVNHGSQSFQTTVSPQPGTTFPGGSTDPLPDVLGTLTNSVYRDPPNGHLAFLYRFDRTSTLQGREDTAGGLTDFDSFTTDIFFGNGLVFDITRSASGDDISFHHFGGLASVPDEILIRTDAKAFSSNSTLGLHTADVFDLFDPAIG